MFLQLDFCKYNTFYKYDTHKSNRKAKTFFFGKKKFNIRKI